MRRLNPIGWFGGKNFMLKRLLPILEGIPHMRYVEPFGGGAVVLLNKRPVELEVYNDIDAGLHNFFVVLADSELFAAFRRRVETLPYSRRLFEECRKDWKTETERVKRAAQWFVLARQSFGADFAHSQGSWGSVTSSSSRGMARTCAGWLSAIEKLPEVSARLRRVQIENQDWRTILDRYDSPDTLFYLDPPYVHSMRRGKNYVHEMTDEDHKELVQVVMRLQGKVVVSGYPNEIYRPLKSAGWEKREYEVACHAAGRTRATGLKGLGATHRNDGAQRRTEAVWIQPYKAEDNLWGKKT